MIFIDMDGVVADWTGQFKKFNKNWIHKEDLPDGYHIYSELDPNEELIEAVRRLQYYDKIAILTSANKDETFETVVNDKIKWLKQFMPFIHIEKQFLCVAIGSEKSTAQMKIDRAESFLKRPLGKKDVLLDDMYNNVVQWNQAGGMGIQYINGMIYQRVINYEHARHIFKSDRGDSVINKILSFANEDFY